MDIRLETPGPSDDEQATLHVAGALTIYEAVEAKGAMLAALRGTPRLQLDLSDVTEIDAAGVQLLILLRREAERCGHRMRIATGSAATEQAISCLNLSELLAGS